MLLRGADLAVTDVGSGPAFLWGHGFSSSRAQEDGVPIFDWGRLSTGFRIVRWDARGHGDSAGTPDPDTFRWDELARDELALADALGIDRFAAGGVSMGTATALHAAVLAPDRIRALVLALPPTAYETRAAQAGIYTDDADLVEQRGLAAYVEQANERPVPEILAPMAEVYRSAFNPAIDEDLLPSALRGAARSDLPEADRIAALEIPALILAWDTDPGHPLATAELLAELLPDAELHVARQIGDILTWIGSVESFLGKVR